MNAVPEIKTVRPQAGPQTKFLASKADIAIYGGAAGGGKSYALLMEPLRHVHNSGFGAVIFRRYTTEVLSEGGLWDTSFDIYSTLARPRENRLDWTFPTGARVSFRHMDHETTRIHYQGAQIPFLGFDEVTEFTWKMFSFMLSRNRSTCGVRPYIRATCNPDPDSFVARLIDWYIGDDGFAIQERSGIIRWFVNINDKIHWGATKEELEEEFGDDSEPKSFTFIPSNIFDNKILVEADPGYIANLKALPYVDRMRLLEGNWRIRPAAGNYFKKEWFPVIEPEQVPAVREVQRYWDRGGTKPNPENEDPDWTVGLKASRAHQDGRFYIEDMVRFRDTPGRVLEMVRNTASRDSQTVGVVIEQDPAQAGKVEIALFIRELAGFNIRGIPVSTDKVTRAKAASAQAEAGNILVVRGNWNDDFFTELENFPEGSHDDIVDTLSGNINSLSSMGLDLTILTRM